MLHLYQFIRKTLQSDSGKIQIILIVASMLFYLIIALFINKGYIGPDGRSYQRMAVNLAEGNGYSNSIQPPFERQFFREPGYPYFFSLACIVNKTLGRKNVHLEYKTDRPGFYVGEHREINILRIMQALLAVLTVLLFYRVLLVFLRPEIASLISLLFIFYLPFAIYITFPQREILVTALSMGLCLLFLKSATSTRTAVYDIVFGVLAALLVLTLQVYIYILPFFLVCHYYITRNYKKTLRSALLAALAFVISVSPWAYRGYLEANNIKVVKTFGVSYTYEFKRYHDVNARAYFENLNGKGDYYISKIIDGYSEPGKTMFEKSFSGYYANYADSLQRVLKEQRSGGLAERLVMMTKTQTDKIRKALVWPIWKTDYRKNISTLLEEGKGVSMYTSLAAGVLVAFLSLFGMVLNIRKTWQYIPVFLFHLVAIPILASEARRVLPFIPFYFMFFILAVVFSIRPKDGRECLKQTCD